MVDSLGLKNTIFIQNFNWMAFHWISWVSPAFNFAVCSVFLKTWVSTSEQSFSAPRRLKIFPTNTVKQDRLNSCMLVHCHKTLADTIDPVAITKTFASANDKGRGILGSSSKRRLFLFKTRNKVRRAGWIGTFHFFNLHSFPPPPPQPPLMEGYAMYFLLLAPLKITSRAYKMSVVS